MIVLLLGFFIVIHGELNALEYRAVFNSDRKLAPCLYNTADLEQSIEYDMKFFLFNTVFSGEEICKNYSKRSSLIPHIKYNVNKKYLDLTNFIQYQESFNVKNVNGVNAGFFVEVNPNVDWSNINQLCYVCDFIKNANSTLRVLTNTKSYKIIYIDEPRIVSFSINFGGSKEDIFLGSNVSMVCEGSGHPQPLLGIIRKRDSKVLAKSVQGDKKLTLYLYHLNHNDSGEYMCTAFSKMNVTLLREKNSTSEVLQLPIAFPPEFKLDKKFRYTSKGVTESLDIIVLASPQPKLNCTISGKAVNNFIKIGFFDPKTSITTFVLTIPQMEEKYVGRYVCCAYNSLGDGCMNFSLIMKPGHVRIISKSQKYRNHITFDWEVRTHKNAPILTYNVFVKPRGEMNGTLQTYSFLPSTSRVDLTDKSKMVATHYLNDLKPGVEYNVELTATNQHGHSNTYVDVLRTDPNGKQFNKGNEDKQLLVECAIADYSTCSGLVIWTSKMLVAILFAFHVFYRVILKQ